MLYGMSVNEGLDIMPISGNRLLGNAKELQFICTRNSQFLGLWVFSIFSWDMPLYAVMLDKEHIENYWRHNTIFGADGITR